MQATEYANIIILFTTRYGLLVDFVACSPLTSWLAGSMDEYCVGLRGEWVQILAWPFCYLVTFHIQFRQRL